MVAARTKPKSGSSDRGDSVNIIIQATDRASGTIDQVGKSLIPVATAAQEAQASLVGLGQALTTAFSGTLVARIMQSGDAISQIKKALASDTGRTVITQIQQQAEEAVTETQKLSDILKAVAPVGKNLLEGFKGKPQADLLEQIPARMEKVTAKLSSAATDRLASAVGSIPIVKQWFSPSQINPAIAAFDNMLSSVVLNGFVARKLPPQLKQAAKIFGQDLGANLGGTVRAVSKTDAGKALPPALRALAEGSVLKALEIKTAEFLTRGFSIGLNRGEEIVGGVAGTIGKKLTDAIFQPATAAFNAFDDLFNNELSESIDRTATKLAPQLVEKLEIGQFARSLSGELTNLISGSLLTGLTGANLGGTVGQFLIQLLGDDLAANAVKKLTGGILVTVGEQVADLTQLTKLAEVSAEQLFKSLVQVGSRNLIGNLVVGLYKQVPEGIRTLVSNLETNLPTQFERVKKSAADLMRNLFDRTVGDQMTSPFDRLLRQADRLDQVAKKAKGLETQLKQVQQAAAGIFESGLSTQGKDALLQRNVKQSVDLQTQIKEAKEAAQEAAELRAKAETLQQKPVNLQNDAMNIALNPNLAADEKNKLVEILNRDIAEAESAMKSPIERLVDQINTQMTEGLKVEGDGGVFGQWIKGFQKVDDYLENTLTDSFAQLGKTAGRSMGMGIGQSMLSNMMPAIDRVDDFVTGTFKRIQELPGKMTAPLDAVKGASFNLAGFGEPLEVFQGLQQGALKVTETVSEASQQFSYFSSAIQSLQQFVVGGPFETLIGQNVKLQEQLLATQSTLAATNQVMQNGVRVDDPMTAIQALGPSANAAIDKIREGSLDLVNVTSKELIDSFQIVAGESSAIGANLSQAADLTLSFGATLGTLGVPLVQARQEIQSILKGTIDQNSIVAKSLGLTNQQVMMWRSQGVLVDQLNKRLEAFRAGNKLAALTMGGVTSNIQEFVDTIGLQIGAKMLDPIVAQINRFYEVLQANKDNLIRDVGALAQKLFNAGMSIVGMIEQVAAATQGVAKQIPGYLVDSLVNAVQALGEAITTTLKILQPAINVMAALFEQARPLMGFFLTMFVQATVLKGGIGLLTMGFGSLAQTLPFVGELMFLLGMRSSSLLNLLPALSSQVGLGAAGFLTLGKNMGAIPGAAAFATKQLAMFGPLAPMLAGMIPAVSGIGIQVAGLAKTMPFIQPLLGNLLSMSPKLIGGLGEVAAKSALFAGTGLDRVLSDAGAQMAVMTRNGTLATVMTEKFAVVTKEAGLGLRTFMVNTTLLAAAAFAAFWVVDNWIIKNETLKTGFKTVWKEMGKVGAVLTGIFNSALVKGLATTAAVAVAINMGLVPAVIKLAQALGTTVWTKIIGALGGLNTAIGTVFSTISNGFKGASLGAIGSFGGISGKVMKLQTELDASNAKLKTSIDRQKALIADLNKQIAVAPAEKVDGLMAQRDKAAAEIAQLERDRAKKLRELEALKAEAIEANPRRMAAVAQSTTSGFAQTLKSESATFSSAIKERKAQIGQLNAQYAQTDAVRDSALRQSIRSRQAALQSEVGEMTDYLRTQGAELATRKRELVSIQQKAANAPTAMQQMGQSFQNLPDTIRKTTQELKNLPAAMQSVGAVMNQRGGVDQLRKKLLDETAQYKQSVKQRRAAIAQIEADFNATEPANTSGRDNLRKQKLEAQANLKDLTESRRVQVSELAIRKRDLVAMQEAMPEMGKRISGALDGVKNSAAGIGKAVPAAAAAVKTAAMGIKGALVGIWAAMGPMIALTVAIAAITEAVGIYTQRTEASRKAISSYNDAIKETQTRMDALRAKIDSFDESDLSKGSGNAAEKAKQRRDDREQELKENASWLLKLGDLGQSSETLHSFGLKSVVEDEAKVRLADEQKALDLQIKRAGELRMGQIKNWGEAVEDEQKLAELRKAAAEATVRGDEDAAKRIGEQVKLREDAIAARKENIDQQIAFLEKQVSIDPTSQQNKALVEQINLLKQLKNALEDIPKTEIKPLDLPRLGSTMEQLRVQMDAARKYVVDGVGTGTEEAKKKIEELFASTDAMVKLGQMTPQEAIANYKLVATNADAMFDTQVKAQDQIAALQQQSADRVSQNIDREKSEVEAAASGETIGEAEKQRQLTQLEGEGLAERLKMLEADARDRAARRADALQEARGAANDQIRAIRESERAGTITPEDANAQVAAINAALVKDTARSNAEQVEDDRKTGIDRQKNQTEIAANAAAARDQERQEMLKDFDEAQSMLEGKRAEGLMSDEAYNQSALNITSARLDEELKIIKEQREKLDPNDTDGLEALAAKEAAINKKRRDSQDQFFEAQRKAAQEDGQEQQQILDGQKAQGLVSQAEYAQKSFDITTAQLDREMAVLKEQQSKLAKTDIEGQERLAAAEGEINKKRVEAKQQYYDRLLAVAEQARQKMLDAAKEAETEREIEIQEQINKGEIKQQGADEARLEASNMQAEAELEAEKQKLADLQAIPSFSDPDAEEKRQQQIRASRQNTHNLSLKLAQNEYQRQEQYRKRLANQLDHQVLAQTNAGQAVILGLEQQQRKVDAINKTYEAQTKILEAKKAYLEANGSLIDAELRALGESSVGEAAKQDTVRITAAIHLRTLDRRQIMEQRILEINQAQQRNALEREKTENEIAQIKNASATARSVADLEKVQNDPASTEADIYAAQLDVVANVGEGVGLRQEAGLLQQEGDRQGELQRMERSNLRDQQQADRLDAETNFINTLSPGDRAAANRARQPQLLGNLGLGNLTNLGDASDQLTDQTLSRMFRGNPEFTPNPNNPNVNLSGLIPQSGNIALPSVPGTPNRTAPNSKTPGADLSSFIQQIGNIALPPIPNLTGRGTPTMVSPQNAGNSPEMLQELQRANQLLSNLGTLQFNSNTSINNNFTGADVTNGRASQQLEQQILSLNNRVVQKLQARR